jgi:alkylhydroperoxidase family enzyme
VSHHGESLRLLGVPSVLVEQLSKGTIPDEAMGEPLRELLRHAVGLTVGQATESGAIEHLRELGWSDAAILDATMVSAYFNMLNRLTTGLGITLESTYAQTCGPDQGSTGPTAVEPFAG